MASMMRRYPRWGKTGRNAPGFAPLQSVSFLILSLVSQAAGKRLPVRFFESESGNVPVRDWLLSLSDQDRKIIGTDIQVVEFGWPIGMPVCRSITGHKGLWEVRSSLTGGRISRVLFCIHDGHMALLHGFEKKTQKTADREIALANRRMKGLIA